MMQWQNSVFTIWCPARVRSISLQNHLKWNNFGWILVMTPMMGSPCLLGSTIWQRASLGTNMKHLCMIWQIYSSIIVEVVVDVICLSQDERGRTWMNLFSIQNYLSWPPSTSSGGSRISISCKHWTSFRNLHSHIWWGILILFTCVIYTSRSNINILLFCNVTVITTQIWHEMWYRSFIQTFLLFRSRIFNVKMILRFHVLQCFR